MLSHSFISAVAPQSKDDKDSNRTGPPPPAPPVGGPPPPPYPGHAGATQGGMGHAPPPVGNGYNPGGYHAGHHPPPPVAALAPSPPQGGYYQQENASDFHHEEEDSGALTSTINMFASAATSLFSSRPQAQNPTDQMPPEPIVPSSYLEASSSYFATDPNNASTTTTTMSQPPMVQAPPVVTAPPPVAHAPPPVVQQFQQPPPAVQASPVVQQPAAHFQQPPPLPAASRSIEPPVVPPAVQNLVPPVPPVAQASPVVQPALHFQQPPPSPVATKAPPVVMQQPVVMPAPEPSAPLAAPSTPLSVKQVRTPVATPNQMERNTTPVRATPRSLSRPRSLPRPPTRGGASSASTTSVSRPRSITPARTFETPSGKSRFRLPPGRSRTPPRAPRDEGTSATLQFEPSRPKETPNKKQEEKVQPSAKLVAVEPTAVSVAPPQVIEPPADAPVAATNLFATQPTVRSDESAVASVIAPSTETAAAEDVAATNPLQQKEEESLPADWSAILDPSSNRHYYVNSLTGERTWDKPATVVPQTQPPATQNEVIQPETDKPSTDSEAGTDLAKEQPASAPEETPQSAPTDTTGFESVLLDAEPTAESREPSSRPENTAMESVEITETAPESVVDELAQEALAPVEPENEVEASQVEGLPEGWFQAVEPSTQRVYYYNSVTGETSWTKPEVPTLDQAVESDEQFPSASEEEPATIPALESTQIDESTPVGEPTQMNEMDELSESKRDSIAALDVGVAQSVVEPRAEIEEPSSLIDSDAVEQLPEGWVKGFDDSSSRYYYYNTTTNESRWDFPGDNQREPGHPPADQNPADEATEPDRDESSPLVDETPESDDRLPDVMDDAPENTNTNYSERGHPELAADTEYKENGAADESPPIENAAFESKVYQMSLENESPEIAGAEECKDGDQHVESLNMSDHVRAEDQTAVPSSADANSTPSTSDAPQETKHSKLPEGWTEQFDEYSKRPFYYNSLTNETSWDPPADSNNDRTEPLHDAVVFDEQVDPSGIWNTEVHEETGQIYYVNTQTGETSWAPPEKEVVPDKTTDNELVQDEASPVLDPPNADEGDTAEMEMVREDVVSEEVESTDENDAKAAQFGSEEAQDTTEVDTNDGPPAGTDADLPSGWSELVDPDTGNIYYYNASTGQSSWELPSTNELPSDSVEDIASGENADVSPDILTEGANVEEDPSQDHLAGVQKTETSEPIESSEMDLRNGWQSIAEPDTGAIYYYNSETGETRWEKPSEVSEVAETIENVSSHVASESGTAPEDDSNHTGTRPENLDAEESESASPPEGWQRLVDARTGKPFYFNEDAGITSWEMPAQDDSRWVDVGVEQHPANAESETQDGSSPDLVAETIVTEAGKEDSHEATEGQAVDGMQESKKVPQEQCMDEVELQDGWVAVSHPESGDVYYFNEKTGATSWERPAESTSVPIESDEQQGSDSGEEHIEQVSEVALRKTESTPPDTGEGKPSSLRLPEGWTEMHDPDAGHVYYYNENTGETSWDRPVSDIVGGGFEDEAKQGTPLGEENGLPSQHVEHENEIVDEDEDHGLPEGWAEVNDPDTGDIYYYNEITEETSWDRPIREMGQSTSADKDQAQLDGEDDAPHAQFDDDKENEPEKSDYILPEGWAEVRDPDSGDVYFYNETTGETSWDPPEDSALGLGETDVGDENIVEVDNDANVVDSQVQEFDSKPGLPEGWEEAVEPDTGTVYYFNETTGETSWEVPADPTAPVEVDGPVHTTSDAKVATVGQKKSWFGPRFCASLGFGGKVCYTQGSRIVIRRIHEMAPMESITALHSERARVGIHGPLSTCQEEVVQNYIASSAEREPADILWNLINILSKSKGRIRSHEPAIMDMLKKNHVEARQLGDASVYQHAHSNGAGTASHVRNIEKLLIEGRRQDALEEAFRCNDYGAAILLATMFGGDLYQQAVTRYTENVLGKGNPLYTLASLSLIPADTLSGFGQIFGSDEALRDSWKGHLAAILNNRDRLPPEWRKAVMALGDRLRDLHEYSAAHFCYMVSGTTMGKMAKSSTKWTLAGCGVDIRGASLNSEETLLSYSKTEGYEWTKRRANARAIIKSLQPFKLVYCHLLADVGFVTTAKAYLEELLPYFESHASNAGTALDSSVPLCHWVYLGSSSGLSKHAHALSARISPGDHIGNMENEADVSFMTAQTHLEPKSDNLKNQEQTIGMKGEPSVPAESIQTRDSKPQMVGATMIAAQNLACPKAPEGPKVMAVIESEPPRETKLPADENSDKAALSSRQPPMMGLPPTASRALPATNTTTPSDPPPNQLDSVQDTNRSIPASTPTRKVAPPPVSAPADLGNKVSTPNSAQKRGMLGMIRGLFGNADEDNAVKADLGGKMEAYYDKEKKRWVFPDDDPNAEDPTAGPPPTTAELQKAPVKEEKKEPLDPLSAMMAPPSRAPRSAIPSKRPPMPNGQTIPPTPNFAVFMPPKPN